MTNAAAQLSHLFSTPTPRTLAEVHNDLQTLMAEYKKNSPARYEQAAALFPRHPAARTELSAAEGLLEQVRALGNPATPANLPFPSPATPQATAQATTVEVPAEPGTPENEVTNPDTEPDLDDVQEVAETPVQPDESEGETDDGSKEGEQADPNESEQDENQPDESQEATPQSAAPTATPAPVAVSRVNWPAEALGSGMLSQLAQTLASGDTLQMIVVRKGDELLVTVDPKPIAGETAGTAIPMQVKGTPAALDTQMVSKLADFKAGRDVAREEVNYAAQVKAAAEAARKAAEASRKASTSTKKPQAASNSLPGTLSLEVAPQTAIVTLTDDKGESIPCKINGDTSLSAGTYTLAVDAEGYAHHEEKVTIKGGAKSKKGIVLKREEVAGLF